MKKLAYLIGIKGVAMTALAIYLKEGGYQVMGSDVKDTFITDKVLSDNQIEVRDGFRATNVPNNADIAIVTGAHGGMSNPEAIYAKQKNIPTYMHGVFLGKLMDSKVGISVAGCHGKTTTSSMIASLLVKSRLDPSYLIGTSEIYGLGPAGHLGKGNILVAEADEYKTCPVSDPTPRFLWQKPQLLIITNIEFDHPDAFKNIEEVKNTFITFTKNLQNGGCIIACIDNKAVQEILPFIKGRVITYGFSPQAEYRIVHHAFSKNLAFMRVQFQGREIGEFTLTTSGKHNLLNGLAASIAANNIGIDWNEIQKNLRQFKGSKRRFELVANMNSILLYDDYAHHPSEIESTLAGAQKWFSDKRIITIFQPHTFSRTKALFHQFAGAFKQSDITVITEIYASAREISDASINSSLLVWEGNKQKKNMLYLPSKEEVMGFLKKTIHEQDVIITMGAGDIFSWHPDIVQIMKSYG